MLYRQRWRAQPVSQAADRISAHDRLASRDARTLPLGQGAHLIIAFALGAMVTAALPPLHLVPLLIIAFVGLLWLIEGSRTWKRAAAIGWAFGFGHFATGLYWLGQSFLVEPDRFGLLPAVPAVLGLSAFLATFSAGAALLAWLIGGRHVGRVLALAVAWTGMEWLRGHVLTGFPWNLVGYIWTVDDAPLQAAAFVGIYGLSFITVLIAALPALAYGHRGKILIWPLAAAIALSTVLWLGGTLRLTSADTGTVPEVKLRLVQPSVPQAKKWDPAYRGRIVSRYLDLSESDDSSGVTHLIWPETALPFFLANEPELRKALSPIIPRGGLLLTGSPRYTESESRGQELWNSLLVLDDTGEIIASYDKAHLVPFGEYMPLRNLLPFENLTEGSMDFSAGPGSKTLSPETLPPFSPLICYEIIFPGAVTDPADRPDWLLNVTNDAWFALSTGPHQHFAMARVRAVEEGLPLVRVANTGISAVVDGYGRMLKRLDLNDIGVIDSPLPAPLGEPTLYARVRDLPLVVLITAALFAAVGTRFIALSGNG